MKIASYLVCLLLCIGNTSVHGEASMDVDAKKDETTSELAFAGKHKPGGTDSAALQLYDGKEHERQLIGPVAIGIIVITPAIVLGYIGYKLYKRLRDIGDALEETRKALGDPHFHMWDGTKYTFKGECDVVAAQSGLLFDDDVGFDLHLRTTIAEQNIHESVISRAALRIVDDVLEVDNEGNHFVNGVADVPLPTVVAGGIKVDGGEVCNDQKCKTTITVDIGDIKFSVGDPGDEDYEEVTAENQHVQISAEDGFLKVQVHTVLLDGGMLGVFNAPGFTGRDGTTMLANVNDFAAEWQVDPAKGDPVLLQGNRAPQFPAACVMPEDKLPGPTRRRLGERRAAENACAIVAPEMFEACFAEVLLTGNMAAAAGYSTSLPASAF